MAQSSLSTISIGQVLVNNEWILSICSSGGSNINDNFRLLYT